jgi:hypothetical protein
MTLRQRLWLCLPALLMYNLDVGLTLAGQDEVYWGGDYSSPDELNPPAHLLLSIHPLLFVAAAVLWEIVFCGLILWLPPRLAAPVALLIAIGHTYGACTWIAYWGELGYVLVVLHPLMAGWLIAFCWVRAGRLPLRTTASAIRRPAAIRSRMPESAG